MTLALYIIAVFAMLFVVSGVLLRWRSEKARYRRVRDFAHDYRAWLEADGAEEARLRMSLAARRDQMQRDAQSVGKGIMYVAPPPMMGGGSYQAHPYFSDLFGTQSYAEYGPTFRLDELATILYEVDRAKAGWRRGVLNPWAWVRLSFERLIGFPKYVLRQAGFSNTVTNSTGVRILTVVWSILVGSSTIGAFIVGLILLGRHQH